jgi:CheY-like chemotaxis protein
MVRHLWQKTNRRSVGNYWKERQGRIPPPGSFTRRRISSLWSVRLSVDRRVCKRKQSSQESVSSSQFGKRPCVFVVDDEHLIALTIAAILRSEGFDAKCFCAPLEALQAARLDTPDLLISDVNMPLMSGIELAIQLKKDCPNCRVLLFSGQAATTDLLRAARTKGYDFDLLSKPAHPTDLLRRIHNVLRAPPTLGPKA